MAAAVDMDASWMAFELPQQLRDYKVTGVLGSGMYGKVLGVRKGGVDYAVKVLAGGRERENGVPYSSVREVMFLSELSKAKNVVKVIETLFAEPYSYVVMEKGAKHILADMPKGGYPAETCLSIVKQILAGLKHCHRNQIVHRDLKPFNVLLDTEGVVKICDFGMARRAELPQRPTTRDVVTSNYRSPELLLSPTGVTDPSIDIWSTGCIFAELATGSIFFYGYTEVDVIIGIFSKLGTPTTSTWPDVASYEYFDQPWPTFPPQIPTIDKLTGPPTSLLASLLTYDPHERPTASEALRSPAFPLFHTKIEGSPSPTK